MIRSLSPVFLLVGLCWTLNVRSQATPTDSTYLRMNDRAKALDAIRFDMAAYADTLRVYRDALDHAATRIDASSAVGEDRQARLGLLRRDARQLEREMRALRKRLRRSSPALVDVARIAGDLVGRTGQLRTRLVAEGAPPRP